MLTPTGQEKVFSQGMTHKGCPGYGGKGMSMFFTVLYSRPSSNRPSSSRQSRAPGWCRQLPAGWVLCLAESHALPAARLMPCCVCDTVVQLSDYMFSTWEHKWLTANFKPSLFAALPWLLLPGNLVVCKELAQDIATGRSQGLSFRVIANSRNERVANRSVQFGVLRIWHKIWSAQLAL